MEFEGTGIEAKDNTGQDIGDNDINKTKIGTLLAGTDWSTAPKFGEGDFALRLTVDDNDIVVELVDKSNFNGGKEYVMDSQTIKNGKNSSNKDEKVTLAGQEIVFTNLETNFVNALQNGGKAIKTLDINLKNEVTKEEDGVKSN